LNCGLRLFLRRKADVRTHLAGCRIEHRPGASRRARTSTSIDKMTECRAHVPSLSDGTLRMRTPRQPLQRVPQAADAEPAIAELLQRHAMRAVLLRMTLALH